jgi:exonuclease III
MSSRQKLNRNNETDMMNQMYLIDVYRIFHPNTKEYTFF